MKQRGSVSPGGEPLGGLFFLKGYPNENHGAKPGYVFAFGNKGASQGRA